MDRIDALPTVILQRIAARLRSELGLNDRQVFLTLEPTAAPTIPPGGDVCLTVALGDGRFDEANQIGGTRETLVEETSVTVTAYVRTKLDAGDHAEALLLEAARGLLVWKQRILKALDGIDLADDNDSRLLVQYLNAIQSWRPRIDGHTQIAMIAVAFTVDFNWDLT